MHHSADATEAPDDGAPTRLLPAAETDVVFARKLPPLSGQAMSGRWSQRGHNCDVAVTC
jgi:hypothetical protein